MQIYVASYAVRSAKKQLVALPVKHMVRLIKGWKHFIPLDVFSRLRAGRRASSFVASIIAALVLTVAWHHVYVPLHLIAHAHVDGIGRITGGSATSPHTNCGENHGSQSDDEHSDEQDGDDHETHPAHDHLTGFYTVCVPAFDLVFTLEMCAAPVLRENVAPDILSISPQERGPPRALWVLNFPEPRV